MKETTVYGIKCEVCQMAKPKGRRIQPPGYLHRHMVCSDCEADIKAADEAHRSLLLKVAKVMGKRKRARA
jgi:hypothetical protein